MKRKDAQDLIKTLTYEEKLALNEMLLNLAQRRPLSPVLPEITAQAV